VEDAVIDISVNGQYRGKAFLLKTKKDTLALTNVHVLSEAVNPVFRHKGKDYKGELVYSWQKDYRDLILIRIKGLADSSSGIPVYSGKVDTDEPFFSFGQSNTFFPERGTLIKYLPRVKSMRSFVEMIPIEFFETKGGMLPGFSGGPLVNSKGQVIGVNTEGSHPGSDPDSRYIDLRPLISKLNSFGIITE